MNKKIFLAFFDNSIAQSTAESPPPAIAKVLSLNLIYLLHGKKWFYFRKSIFSIGGLLGPKAPFPAAIIMHFACIIFSDVLTL